MSDTSHFGFGKFVPGFDFLQNLAKGASSSIPQLPQLSNWVAPTVSVEELEKRIEELKAVQFWLEQNSRALAATIQALEVQKMTLATLKGMNFSFGDVANAFKLKAADTVASSVQKATDARAEAAAPTAGKPSAAQQDSAKAARADKADEAPSLLDPMQWWGALTSQFQQIAANALKDAAQQPTPDSTKHMAGLTQEAFKTATGMASQLAAQGVQGMQDAARMAKGAATVAKAPTAAKKPAARAAARPAAKSATQKPPARRAPRKPAG